MHHNLFQADAFAAAGLAGEEVVMVTNHGHPPGDDTANDEAIARTLQTICDEAGYDRKFRDIPCGDFLHPVKSIVIKRTMINALFDSRNRRNFGYEIGF